MDDFKNCIRNLTYSSRIAGHQMFVFGEQIGTGEDDDHFQCGLTSLNLLNRVEDICSSCVFHVDATYKIIKHCFPLIVFGYTDIARKFYPVCFIFTSHETTIDYTRFFTTLSELCGFLNIKFMPSYIVIDASHAIANSIKKLA